MPYLSEWMTVREAVGEIARIDGVEFNRALHTFLQWAFDKPGQVRGTSSYNLLKGSVNRRRFRAQWPELVAHNETPSAKSSAAANQASEVTGAHSAVKAERPSAALRKQKIAAVVKQLAPTGRRGPWARFCDDVRKVCGVPPDARGYNDKTIERVAKSVWQDKMDKTDKQDNRTKRTN